MCAESTGVLEETSFDCSEICKIYDILSSVLLSRVVVFIYFSFPYGVQSYCDTERGCRERFDTDETKISYVTLWLTNISHFVFYFALQLKVLQLLWRSLVKKTPDDYPTSVTHTSLEAKRVMPTLTNQI